MHTLRFPKTQQQLVPARLIHWQTSFLSQLTRHVKNGSGSSTVSQQRCRCSASLHSHIISVCLKHDRSVALGSAVPQPQVFSSYERALLENCLSPEARDARGECITKNIYCLIGKMCWVFHKPVKGRRLQEDPQPNPRARQGAVIASVPQKAVIKLLSHQSQFDARHVFSLLRWLINRTRFAVSSAITELQEMGKLKTSSGQ